MTADYSTLLFILVLVLSAILAIDRIALQARRRRDSARDPGSASMVGTQGRQEALLVAYARSLFPPILLVLILRCFLFEPFRIPSPSMMPGLVDGDFIVVNKFAYGLRLPLFNHLLLAGREPRRGDVIVFRSPAEPEIDLIKRLVGLPGDHIVVRNNRLFINGALIPLRRAGRYAGADGFGGAALARERFGQAEHVVMFARDRPSADFDGVVPAKHYFFMGDNRNDSEDSRFQKVGFVSRDRLIGHAVGIWMSWRIPDWPQWRRVGLRIQ